MAENHKTSKYNDGTPIPNIKDKKEWINLKTGAWCNYNNDVSNDRKYGKLYNWYSISPETNENKNVCPTGWHVPTYYEWDDLASFLGNEEGKKLKEVGALHWVSYRPPMYINNVDATNISLFTALPGGCRDTPNSNEPGRFSDIREYGFWWSSSLYSSESAYHFSLSKYSNFIDRGAGEKIIGFSIRCIKGNPIYSDEEILFIKSLNKKPEIENIEIPSEPIELEEKKEEEIFEFTDEEASFPGGKETLNDWIKKNIQYPQASVELGEQGKVYISFIVEPDGKISNPVVERGVSDDLDREAKRLIKSMPKWKAAKNNGKAVRVRGRLPIAFNLE